MRLTPDTDIFIFNVLLILLFSTACLGQNADKSNTDSILDTDSSSYFNAVFGISPFLGVLGIEYQHEEHAFGIGYPNRLSYRYYFKPYKDTLFAGTYLGGMNYNDVDEKHDGIRYDNLDTQYVGAGAGYRWQWSSGWNTSLSLALHYYDYDFSNPGTSQSDSEDGFFVFPGANVGYKF